MTTTTCTTTADFYVWAQKRLANTYSAATTWKLNAWRSYEDVVGPDGEKYQPETYTNWRGEQDTRYLQADVISWSLEETGRTYHGDVVKLPREIGEALAAGWKTNDSGRYVGQRNAVGLLKLLDAKLAKTAAEAGKQARELEQRRTATIKRNNYRATVQGFAESMVKAMERAAADGLTEFADSNLPLSTLLALAMSREEVPTE